MKLSQLLVLSAVFGVVSNEVHAQGSVNIYGILDTGVLYQSRTANDAGKGFSALDAGGDPTLWGLTGTEDLGAGYKAVFKLESGFSTVNGGFGNSNGNFWGRNAYVGVETPYGTLHAGLEISSFFNAVALTDPVGTSFFASAVTTEINAIGLAGAIVSNGLSYTSPTIAGLQIRIDHGFGNVAGNFRAGSHTGASANYGNGPFSATIAYFTEDDPVSGASTYRGLTANAGYAVGPVTARLSFSKFRNMSTDAPLTNVNVFGAGAEWQITPAVALTAIAYASQDTNVRANKSMLYRVGAQYFLSKRTTLYGQVGLVHNDADMNTTLAVNAPTSFAPPQGTTVGVNVGIRHMF
ncbi:gram-negative porin family protein [Paraburkholderia xenovorans LB400]|uniref:Outer membrane porin, OmpC family n=1 Tax=Paraburkholderia xenovorans (strain LB400) TaxID=266265 RepID=Q13I92_PARXL|nr:porin [Paraburkholderia xenovorans]ABE36197.1 outer membrane porin, OmpC family [Paraburkholderia xenovorans LB400]AIP34145.1 gram-negative porin family protein [Paraburkholderia xenovorans LB400]